MSKSDPCDCGTPFQIHTLENPQCSVSHPQHIKPSEQNESPREQLKSLDLDRFIPESEEIFCMVKCQIHKGKNGKIDDKSKTHSGFALVTEKNIYFIKKPLQLFGNSAPYTKEVVPISHVTGLDQTHERWALSWSYHVQITRANNEDILRELSEETATQFVDAANAQIAKLGQKNYNTIDPIEQLTKLGSLLEKGLITQEEFDLKKKELLAL
jgi:hypothetical protein